jgi:hypothetical protein
MRLLTYIPFRDVSIYTESGGVYTATAIPDAHYAITAGSMDSAIDTALAAATLDLSASIEADGRFKITRAGGGTSKVIWFDSGEGIDNTWLRDALGFSGDTADGTTTAPRYSPYRLDITGIAVDDMERPSRIGMQAETDTGLYTLQHGIKRYRNITIPLRGYPRGIELSDYIAADDFASFSVLPGLAFRYYPDTSVTLAVYNRATNPFGYQVYSAISTGFEPSQRGSDSYDAWTWSLRLHPAVEPSDYIEI